MEVHAHSHTERKKWYHYFWEFLMLFLAVYCGFLAENIREHKVEKERGIQFVKSFYEDLKKDTLRLTGFIDVENAKIKSLSTYTDCYAELEKNPRSTSCIFELIKNSSFNNPFQYTDRTIRQLANAGGYRLLPKNDADSIIEYEYEARSNADFSATVYQQAQDNLRSTFNTIINFSANSKMYRNITENRDYNDNVTTPFLFFTDRGSVNKYFNELLQYLRVTVGSRNQNIVLKQKATHLILYFKEKYHWE